MPLLIPNSGNLHNYSKGIVQMMDNYINSKELRNKIKIFVE